MKKLINFALAFLALHLFSVHSKLIFHLNPDNILFKNNESGRIIFSFLEFNEHTIIALISALAYSIITVILIKVFKSTILGYLIFIGWFSLLDGIGVFIYYMNDLLNKTQGVSEEITAYNYFIFGSIYYALYTGSIIVCFGLHKKHEFTVLSLSDKINNLHKSGKKAKEIADELNININKVYRLLNKA